MLKNTFFGLFQTRNAFKYVVPYSTKSQLNTVEKWDVLSAVCLERRPVITATPKVIEEEYKQLCSELELERSLKSKFELRHEADIKHLEILKKGGELDDTEANLKQTAQDLKDAWSAEFAEFKPASRITEDDQKNNLTSLNRKLDKHLVFVINQKIGNKKFYMLPQGLRQDGETLRQTAERVLKEAVGSKLKAQFYNNAPCGFYKYKYPHNVRNEKNTVGAKIFIYFARYQQGQPQLEGLDYKWLDRQELQKTLPSEYIISVNQFLIDD